MAQKKIIRWTLTFFALDMLTKQLFYSAKIGASTWLLEPVFNTGISWGIGIPSWIVIGISVCALVLFVRLGRKGYLSTWVLILLIAGTYGNLFDRIMLGGVRDFISIGSFPVFNLADSYLTIAVAILLRNEIFTCNFIKKQ